MKLLLSEDEIQTGVTAVAKRIAAEYQARPLTILGVLTGSLIFLADLVRRLETPLRIGLIEASSYRGETTSPGQLTIDDRRIPDLAGRDVLLLDDIFDTGQTLAGLLQAVSGRNPCSLRSVVLLWKEGRQVVDVSPDFYCFRIPDAFVVGYGLDYNGEYRHLPYLATLDERELTGAATAWSPSLAESHDVGEHINAIPKQ